MKDVNDEQPPLPAIYGHCERTYQAMRAQAEARDVEGGRIIVWEGFLTQLLGKELNLPTPYYTSVRNNLVRMECVRQLQRGGGNSPSQWELIRPPTPKLFLEKAPKRSQRDRELETLRGQVSDLRDRQNKLEKMFQQVVDFVNGKSFEDQPAQGNQEQPTDHTPLPPRTGVGAETDETEKEALV